ncbi:MAG TPA: hypothetical protein VFF03_14400 [Rhodocyclaceae bacterium]|nr:hypothetical protein [Rhodocyclaceae bacterium]
MSPARLVVAAALAAAVILAFVGWLDPANVLAFVSSQSFCQ